MECFPIQFESQGFAEDSKRALTCVNGASEGYCNVRAHGSDVDDSPVRSSQQGKQCLAAFWPKGASVHPAQAGDELRSFAIGDHDKKVSVLQARNNGSLRPFARTGREESTADRA